MTCSTTRVLVGAALTVLLGSSAVVPAVADPVAPAAPVVSWVTSATTVAGGGTYSYGAVPAAPTCTAVNEMAVSLPCAVTGHAATVGVHTLTAVVEGAPAGTLAYTVTATWRLKGFYGSVKEGGTWNTRNGGSTIPLSFKIYDGEDDKSKTVRDIRSFVAVPIPCVGRSAAVGAVTLDLMAAAKKGFSLKYRDGAFRKNWKTSKVKATTVTVPAKGHGKAKSRKITVPSCYRVTMTAVDGQTLTALFKLR